MIDIQGLKKSFGSLHVINNITTTVEKGEVISIIGPSGTGKSTFMRCINMLETPDAGSITFNGIELTGKKVDKNAIRKKMGMVFQSFNLFSHMTVMENVTVGPVKLLKASKAEAEKEALRLLAMVGLEEKASYYPDELSGGQKQRIAIARCLSMKPEIMLFDEPTSALDPTMVGEVIAVINNLAKTGITMMIVTHEMKLAKNVSTRVLYLDEGGIYEEGSAKDIFENPKKPKTQAFIRQIKSFNYTIASEKFDFIGLMNELINFCMINSLPPADSNRIQLIVEELVTLLSKDEPIELNVSFPENQEYHEVNITYGGKQTDITKSDTLSATIIKKSSKTIDYSFDDKNHIKVSW